MIRYIATLALALTLSFTARAADTVKLRALELKDLSVSFTDPTTGHQVSIPVHYADLVRQVLLTAPANGRGTDDVVRSVEVWEPIKKIIDQKGTRVLLSDSDYQFLLQHINGFNWGGAPDIQETIADFIKYVRGLKEAEFPVSDPKT